MEGKSISVNGYKSINKKIEKICNKCGFATYYLRVLYRHKYKCQGKLLGLPLWCNYCKRKFAFPFLLIKHKRICVKHNKKKKLSLKKIKSKIIKPRPVLNKNIVHTEKSELKPPSTIVCPLCLQFFTSRADYNAHEPNCAFKLKQQVKQKSFSARKSFPSAAVQKKTNSFTNLTTDSDSESSLSSDGILSDVIDKQKFSFNSSLRSFICICCKKVYPTKKTLLKHLQLSHRCALAFYEQDSYRTSHKARKTLSPVVARKSFSRANYINNLHSSKKSGRFEGSARKSFPNSSSRQSFKSCINQLNSLKELNQCPVCYEEFVDSFVFFHHQKKLNHWGKATKSMNTSCKCPFCHKEFFSVRARNAHIRNHADKSDNIIETFLKSTTCDICSQIFVSETVKMQHIKLQHSKQNQNFADKITAKSSQINSIDKENIFDEDSSKYSSLPQAMKEKLKEYPLTCPVCSKDFVTTPLRNKHFEDSHLSSDLECKFCPIKCSSESNLNSHMQQFHSDYFNFECSVCKEKFLATSHLMLHMKKFHLNEEKIQPSTETKDQETSKTNEVERNKGQEKQDYFCDICNLNFQKLHFLRRHEQSKQHRDTLIKNLDAVHESLSNIPPSPPPLPKQIPTPDVLSCSECFEEFTSLKDFVPHRLSHFGEKGKYMEINEENTYTCEICGDVSDSHSKVQMHLFWHLQVESTSKEKKTSLDTVKNDSVLHVKSNNQHVAKKSFGKQSHEPQQEVVIGGIKKHLFTCEACHIGFTNQTHYNLHVRRFCKMKNNISPKKILNEGQESVKKSLTTKTTNLETKSPEKPKCVKIHMSVEHCHLCYSIYTSPIKNFHDDFCSKCRTTNLEIPKDINRLKSRVKLQKAVGACIECGCSFITPQNFSHHMITQHMLVQESSTSEESEQKENILVLGEENVIHCQTCNFIFFTSDILQHHEEVCCKFEYGNSKLENFTPDFKSALEQNSIVGSCVACDLAFNNSDDLVEHVKFHQEKLTLDAESESETATVVEEIKVVEEEKMNTEGSPTSQNTQILSIPEGDIVSNADIEHQESPFNGQESLDFSDSLTNAHIIETDPIDHKDDSVALPNSFQNSEIESLRNNFSQLFTMLMSDPELMEKYGFGERKVDEVLVSVLQTMKKTPVLKDENTSELDCLSRNILILLEVCIEDRIMEVIKVGKASTDEIVVAALKLLRGELSITIANTE